VNASAASRTPADRFDELAAMLDSLLRIRCEDGGERAARCLALVTHEMRRQLADAAAPTSRAAALARAPQLSAAQWREVRVRSLYYAAQELVALLALRAVRRNAVLREEAVLYVLERLQRDDFRRIDSFDPSHGASFKTYLWQVVSRLLIDFQRSRARERRTATEAFEPQGTAPGAEDAAAEREMRDVVGALLIQESATDPANHSLRERLRRQIALTSRERLFLKAIFQHDMSVDEVRRLPGFEMSSGAAWRLYYGLLERLVEDFKDADALGAVRALLGSKLPLLDVAFATETARIEVTRIRHVAELTDATSACQADWRGAATRGVIADGIVRLKRKLAPWFTAVNSTTLVADTVLRELDELRSSEEIRSLRIPGIDAPCPVARAQLDVLRRRFAKNDRADSYKSTDTEAGTDIRAQR
jgi:RNA polymerase sigma factor (sigma-70 family)